MLSRNIALAASFIAMVVLALALWQLAFILLLGFFGLLLAILLRQPAQIVASHTRLPVGLALALVTVGFVALAVGFVVSAGPQVLAQLE